MIRNYSQPPLPPRVWDEIVGKMVIGHKMHEFAIAFRCILMQPIYAKDRKGKQIYELDVSEAMGIIIYGLSGQGYYIYYPEDEEYRRIGSSVRIIGHIFQPEFKDLYDAVKGELGI